MMHDWLVERGVPESALALDYEGLTTLQSLQQAQERFHIVQPLILSQRFHLPRALFLAYHVGIEGMGVVGDRREYHDRYFSWAREVGAYLKAAYQVYHPTSTILFWIRTHIWSPSKLEAIEDGRMRLREIFQARGLSYPPKNVLLVGIKSAKKLLVFAKRASNITPPDDISAMDRTAAGRDGSWMLVKKYPIFAASGVHGPKLTEGDRQVPEGVYRVTYRNEKSRFHLALRLDYPNEFDKSHAVGDGRIQLGSDIMIHGSDVSTGCLALGNAGIEEIFALAVDSDIKRWKVILMPTWPSNFAQLLSDAEKYPKWYPALLGQIDEEIGTLVFQDETQAGSQSTERVWDH